MDLARLFMRMAWIIRHPPSTKKLIIMGVVAAVVLGLVAIEWAGYAPDWMKADRIRGVPR